MRVLISSPLHIHHTPISLKDPDAKYSPFGENTTLETNDEWPEGFDSFSTRYSPHSDSIRSRRQILSVWRKYYASDEMRVSSEGIYSFSARYPPHSDSISSRRQILSIRRKYYALNCMRVPFEGFDAFTNRYSPQFDNVISRTRR